jgi:hypothetical protein
VEKDLPTKSLILGLNGNETVNQINTGNLAMPGGQGVSDLKQSTGWRSAQFDFLLQQPMDEKPNRQNSPYLNRVRQGAPVGGQDTYNQYIN